MLNEREEKNDTSLSLLLFLYEHTRANWWPTIQMWISRNYNCQNKKKRKKNGIIYSTSSPN